MMDSWALIAKLTFLQRDRPLQASHDLRASGRRQDNVLSHLPLHSQHLARTPYPMIPIGGIQMVQARPSMVPGPVLALQAGHLVPSAGRAARTDGSPPSPPEPSSESVSPVAKVSKYALSPERPAAGGFPEEQTRTSELRAEQEAEPGPEQQPRPSAAPGGLQEPSAGGHEPSKGTGKQQSGSSSSPSEPACTLSSAVPSVARHSPSGAAPAAPQARPRSPRQTHGKVDENAGSA
ncbi:transcription factor HIVEP3-like [Sylvia atricapilla]|uniref:transcription factor HIVEP3-like n=1 Tax=Sylvia atricapilla TaxID=48155 RepID=UPI003393DC61